MYDLQTCKIIKQFLNKNVKNSNYLAFKTGHTCKFKILIDDLFKFIKPEVLNFHKELEINVYDFNLNNAYAPLWLDKLSNVISNYNCM